MKVIAEVGSNWKTFNDCLISIAEAKRIGADAVKFQYFTSTCLYGEKSGRQNTPAVEKLAEYAKMMRIEFMCTAFSVEGYKLIDPLVVTHKIASSEITDIDILTTVNSFKKPVLLSIGGATLAQLHRALLHLKHCPVTILYCVADYPARVIDFRMLDQIREIYGQRFQYGYSDHSIDVLNIPVLARNHGAVVLEKHVNFTKHTDTPDAPHSLSTEECALMIKHLRGQTTISDTFHTNLHQRQLITLPQGASGYFRPQPDA